MTYLGSIALQPSNEKDSGELEKYFASFRGHILGSSQTFESPYGTKKIIYADWTASGRAYGPIEDCIQREVLPFVGNTHTDTTVTGGYMSKAYETAKAIIKQHVHACGEDVLLFCGSGMTAAVNKLQRMLGLRIPESASPRPIVFVTHMEHHSNHISWLETIADVEIIACNAEGNVDLANFAGLLERFKDRKLKIAAVTACSNVTGIQTPYHEIAGMIHDHEGYCFVDFACSAPYAAIDMHPDQPGAWLDAIYFSPHKFLGGPGAAGVLILHKKLCQNKVPDQPGGGTVAYTNPWKAREYVDDPEQREDGGTPPFLQGIRAAMCIRLKEAMGIENIAKREGEIMAILFDRFDRIQNIEILEGHNRNRSGIISFLVKDAHYGLIVKILNDQFGIQTRGGCSCAGPYGHHLLKVDSARSLEILAKIRSGDLHSKPGWIRLSIHPAMSNEEIFYIMHAIEWTANHFRDRINDYIYDGKTNEYVFKGPKREDPSGVKKWFDVKTW